METELVYRPSVDLLRLRWKVEKRRSVLSCVSVLDDGTNADSSPQQPFVTGSADHHPVGEEPFSEPPTKMFNAKIRVLDGVYADDLNRQDSLSAEEQDRQHAMLQDDKWHGPCKYITAEGNFITIREFVEAVHPWLVSLSEEYLKQQGLAILGQPMRSNAWLWVDAPWCMESSL